MSVSQPTQSKPIAQLSRRVRGRIAILLAAPVVALGIAGLQHQQDGILFALAIISYAVLCVPLIGKRSYSVVEPYSIVFTILYLGVPLKLSWLLLCRDTPRLSSVLLGLQVEDFIAPSLLTIVALCSLCAGYMAGAPRRRELVKPLLSSRRWNTKMLVAVSAFAVSISIVVFMLYAQRIGLGSGPISAKRFEHVADGPMQRGSLSYYRWAASFTQIVSYVLFAWAITTKLSRGHKVVTGIAISIPIFLSLVTPFINSSRFPIVFFMLECMVILYCLKDNVFSKRWLTFQLTGVAVVVLLFSLILALRRDSNNAGTGVGTITAFDIVEHVIGDPYLADVTKTAHIIRAVPDRVPYQLGSSYAALFVAPIPRDLWPAKPSIGAGPFVGTHIYGYKHTGVPPGLIGEAYLNFGLIGMMFVPFVYGWMVRWSYEILVPSLRLQAGAIAYAICFRFYVAALGMDFAVGLIQCMSEMLPALAIIFIVQFRHPNSARRRVSMHLAKT